MAERVVALTVHRHLVSGEWAEGRGWRTEEMLMTVKAYRNPHESFGEADRTAGNDRDGRCLRVNPVPFRQLRKDQQFEPTRFSDAKACCRRDCSCEDFDTSGATSGCVAASRNATVSS